MTFRAVIFCLTALLAGAITTRAGDEPMVGYILSRSVDSLVVRPDFSALVTDEAIGKLRTGIGLVFEYRLSLKTPRRFFGSRTAAETGGMVQIAYRILTEDFVVRLGGAARDTGRAIGTAEQLSEYLADSLRATLADSIPLELNRGYRLDLQITSIYLTDLNLLAGRDVADSSAAPLEYLFRQFLDLTGYGRTELSYSSRPFRIVDLPIEP